MVSGLLALVACGSRSDIDAWAGADRGTERLRTDTEGSGAPIIPRRCVEDWQTLYEASGVLLAPALALSGQELLFGESDDTGRGELRALDLGGSAGRYRVVTSRGSFSELWVADGDVLLWLAGRLFRVPLAGGAVRLELGPRGPIASPEFGGAIVLRPDMAYWTELGADDPRVGLWRQPRPGTERELVAWLDGMTSPADGLAVGDGYAVVAAGARAVAVTLTGGAETPLALIPEGSFAGIDALGVYHSRPANRTRRGGRALEYEIQRSPADGGDPVRFWKGAAGEFIDSLWPHGSGWLATGRYYRSDGRQHAVVLYIAGDGSVHQLACAPDAERRIMGRPLLTGGSLYLVLVSSGENTANLVHVRLAPDDPQ